MASSEMGEVPLGTKGRFQERIRAGDFTRALIEEVLPLLNNNTTGARGVIRDFARNTVGANLR